MLSYFLQLQQVLDAFIIFTAQQAETYSTLQNIELPSVQSSGNASSLKSPLMQFSPSNIRIAPFPTREYTDDEFQGLLYVLKFLNSTHLKFLMFQEQKIKEGLYMMGLKDGVFHLSWFITYALQVNFVLFP
ncbi:ABC transporter A family member 1 isoform X2 [Fagus crenata]